jgi:hypothetical protein
MSLASLHFPTSAVAPKRTSQADTRFNINFELVINFKTAKKPRPNSAHRVARAYRRGDRVRYLLRGAQVCLWALFGPDRPGRRRLFLRVMRTSPLSAHKSESGRTEAAKSNGRLPFTSTTPVHSWACATQGTFFSRASRMRRSMPEAPN